MKTRRNELDFLKTLGLLCIILAHVNPPAFVLQLRNFDVPMMLLLSGILARMSFERSASPISPIAYIGKRFCRLVLPTWLFLMVYFLFLLFFDTLPSSTKILRSFLLGDSSIGYVWIVSVYMVCAALTPFAMHINLNNRVHVLLLATLYALHETLFHYRILLPYDMLNDLLYYIIPYGLILILGLNYTQISHTKKRYILCISFLIYFCMAVCLYFTHGEYVPTQSFKYPARIYYLSYAVACSFLLLDICSSHRDCRLFKSRIVRFVSSSSFWIYLWHILALKLITVPLWPVRLVLVTALSCLITYAQRCLIDHLMKAGFGKRILSIFIG